MYCILQLLKWVFWQRPTKSVNIPYNFNEYTLHLLEIFHAFVDNSTRNLTSVTKLSYLIHLVQLYEVGFA